MGDMSINPNNKVFSGTLFTSSYIDYLFISLFPKLSFPDGSRNFCCYPPLNDLVWAPVIAMTGTFRNDAAAQAY
jgi:hypothetical protein